MNGLKRNEKNCLLLQPIMVLRIHHQVVENFKLPIELQLNFLICQNHSSKKNHYKNSVFTQSINYNSQIPKQYWDANLSILPAKFKYVILKQKQKKDAKKKGKPLYADEPAQPPPTLIREIYEVNVTVQDHLAEFQI
ncbi:unnamed protein product [Paramecium primaurelia]|uniref:Uncharacterized protein n=1 Tax=Paramecium primaurelia TaxID=5886 RepID=A0A8S1NFN1_PARPR|nr:unnamed protein product [Paramecium primaurelia]